MSTTAYSHGETENTGCPVQESGPLSSPVLTAWSQWTWFCCNKSELMEAGVSRGWWRPCALTQRGGLLTQHTLPSSASHVGCPQSGQSLFLVTLSLEAPPQTHRNASPPLDSSKSRKLMAETSRPPGPAVADSLCLHVHGGCLASGVQPTPAQRPQQQQSPLPPQAVS